MRFFNAEELREVFDFPTLIDALEDGHRKARPELVDGLIGPADSRYMVRSAHNGANLIGSKLITIFPQNQNRHDLPSVQAAIMLFDAEYGRPTAVLDATELTYWKTAADSALGSKLLSRPNAKTLVIAGAGGLAPWLVRGHLAARPSVRRVMVWNRTPARAEVLADELVQSGIAAEPASSLKAAVGVADIVTTATMARDPILKGDWLKSGTHVDLVGGYSSDTREADDTVLKNGRLFVDCRDSALDGIADIAAPMDAGMINENDILGDLFDLVGRKTVGRQSNDEITVFKNAGGAHLDLMVAAALVKKIEAHAT